MAGQLVRSYLERVEMRRASFSILPRTSDLMQSKGEGLTR